MEQDYKKALKWYTKAAQQGHAYAQYVTGVFYLKGMGAAQNVETAVKWFQKSAAQEEESAVKALKSLGYWTDERNPV